jgi:hypothetical protein
MRYRTAGILSVGLIGGMFGFPAVVEPIFLPSFFKAGLAQSNPGLRKNSP